LKAAQPETHHWAGVDFAGPAENAGHNIMFLDRFCSIVWK
jgi:hypothetical protein